MMRRSTYKVLDLFGNEQIIFSEPTKAPPGSFHDYDAFVDKFEAKKTTDDCYTPPEVFDIVLNYVRENCDIEGLETIRPFYPGGDFEAIEYGGNCVVIDNPPFSIISKIARLYIKKGVKFFLFAPHLTLFSSDIDCTHIVVGGDIEYENGAKVRTSFLSNMFGDAKVIGDADLLQKFNDLNASKKANLPKYEYPKNVLTVSHIQWLISRGVSIRIDKNEVKHCRGLDSQRPHKKAIFGSGFLISERAALERAALERAALEKEVSDDVHVWELSNKEKAIIASLKINE